MAGSYQLATIVFVHDPTNPNPYVLQGERMYDVIFQSDKSLASKIPQSMIKNGQQSIFWRLLRPEFVKHRGQSLIKKYFTVSDIQNASENADVYSELQIQDSSRRNSDHLQESVQHKEVERNYTGDGSKVCNTATASACASQSTGGIVSDKNYVRYGEIGKKQRSQISCTEQQEAPLQQRQQHLPNINQPSSSPHFNVPTICGAENGYVSSYTAAEQLFEYQAAPQSINICDTRNQSSTYDSMYSAADEICSGASVRSSGEVYSGYRSSSYSSSSEEYSHHYRNIYHNRNYYNYDNYMLHASSGGDSSKNNRNICQERGGIGDEACGSEVTIQHQVEHATQVQVSALHGLPSGLIDSSITESMNRQLQSPIPHDSDTSSAACTTLRRLQTHLPLSSSSTPSLLIPSSSISHPHGAYHVEKREAWNVPAEYSPSYITAEQLFGYQATAPDIASRREQTATTLGVTVQPYSRDNELHVNCVRDGHGRSRSEGTSTLLQLAELSSAVKASERANNTCMSSNEHVNNSAAAGTSMMKRGTPILIQSVCVTDEPWKRRVRSESLDSAREHARTRTHQHPLSPVNGAMNTFEKKDNNDKNTVSQSDSQRGLKIQNSAVNGLSKEHRGDYNKNLENRSVDTGSHSSLTTSEEMTRSTATKDPPPLSSDSLSAFSGAYVINVNEK